MKTKLNISKKAMEWAIIFGFICSAFWSFADFDASCEELRHNVLRLHIVANSDSPDDQKLKLKIRDEILKQSEELFSADCDLKTATETARNNLSRFEKIANGVIKENGFSYTANANIGTAFFETRVYDDFTLPGGNYQSLIINIGEARGKNWWCVVFPGVCLPTGDSELAESVNEKGVKIAEDADNYIIRFKTVEIYEKIKEWVSG